jgi:hypothetical protein
MTPGEFLIILALTGYAVYQQTRRHEVVGKTRFKLAIIYAIIGLVVGGFNFPHHILIWVFLVISLLLSLIVGLIRGRLTRVWREGDHVYSKGTVLTVSLFLGLIVAKFILGTIAYLVKASDDGGIGEILLMIAVMVAVQAELIWRRAQALGAAYDPPPDPPSVGGPPTDAASAGRRT